MKVIDIEQCFGSKFNDARNGQFNLQFTIENGDGSQKVMRWSYPTQLVIDLLNEERKRQNEETLA